MNSLLTLVVYRHGAMWVFDDARRGLDKEPFVAGMGEIIDDTVRKLPYAALGFNLTFAARQFPGADTVLERETTEWGGTWYRVTVGPAYGRRGWLCPALFRYFDVAPQNLYIHVAPIEHRLV